MIERQELHCHACDKYVQFNVDTELEGNHVLKCPNCGHEHCRVVKNGVVTDERWGQCNGSLPTYYVPSYSITYTGNSTFATASTSTYSYTQWMNTSSSTGTW